MEYEREGKRSRARSRKSRWKAGWGDKFEAIQDRREGEVGDGEWYGAGGWVEGVREEGNARRQRERIRCEGENTLVEVGRRG